MIAYVTTIGEPTTEICCEQLERFGFDVQLFAGKEDWIEKFRRFIVSANQNVGDEGCIRIDADVIPNGNIRNIYQVINQGPLMAQWKTYDFYRNGVGVTSPVYYSKEAIEIILEDWDQLDHSRPEATSWRLPRINNQTITGDEIVGMHGFFQDDGHLARHLKNKIERKQMSEYDFDLAVKIKNTLT